MKCLLLLAFVVLAGALLVSADDEPTCKLTALLLTNKATNQPLDIRDVHNNPFNPSVYTYFCTCEANVNQVTVTLKSEEVDITYEMNFTPGGSDTVAVQQFLSLQTASQILPFAVGTNRVDILPSCSVCSAKYTVYCYRQPGGGSSVVGDPQFTGLRGQEYQVHGVSGEVYNIISDEHLQMNSQFVFLDRGECPELNGMRAQGCWSHPGSYLGSIGIKTSSGDRLKLVSGDYRTGFAAVELNGVPMSLESTMPLPCVDASQSGWVSLNSSFLVTVRFGHFLLEFENSDMFVNQNVRVVEWSTINAHGMLGQTWRRQTYKNAIKHIEGAVDDYAIKGKDLFGDLFFFNQFRDRSNRTAAEKAKEAAPAAVNEHRHEHPHNHARDDHHIHRASPSVSVTIEPVAATPVATPEPTAAVVVTEAKQPEPRLRRRRNRGPSRKLKK